MSTLFKINFGNDSSFKFVFGFIISPLDVASMVWFDKVAISLTEILGVIF